MTDRNGELKISGAHCDLLDNAVVVLVLGWVENPAVGPGETEQRCQNEMLAAEPALVGVTNRQLLRIAWKIVFHGKVDMLISACVGGLEQFKCIVVKTLWLVVRKLNCLSTARGTKQYYYSLWLLHCYLMYYSAHEITVWITAHTKMLSVLVFRDQDAAVQSTIALAICVMLYVQTEDKC